MTQLVDQRRESALTVPLRRMRLVRQDPPDKCFRDMIGEARA
jgi:hypothetical protein